LIKLLRATAKRPRRWPELAQPQMLYTAGRVALRYSAHAGSVVVTAAWPWGL